MDDDLQRFDREELIAEVRRLRAGIRAHRDSSGHDLCWHHPQLWGLLPEGVDPHVAVPPWPKFMRGCIAYRRSLDREFPTPRSPTSNTTNARARLTPGRSQADGRAACA
jgi:hypothetical protein